MYRFVDSRPIKPKQKPIMEELSNDNVSENDRLGNSESVFEEEKKIKSMMTAIGDYFLEKFSLIQDKLKKTKRECVEEIGSIEEIPRNVKIALLIEKCFLHLKELLALESLLCVLTLRVLEGENTKEVNNGQNNHSQSNNHHQQNQKKEKKKKKAVVLGQGTLILRQALESILVLGDIHGSSALEVNSTLSWPLLTDTENIPIKLNHWYLFITY